MCASSRWPTFFCVSGGAAVGGRDARQTVRPVQGAGGQGGAGVGRGGGSAGCGNGRSGGGRRRQRPVALRGRWEKSRRVSWRPSTRPAEAETATAWKGVPLQNCDTSIDNPPPWSPSPSSPPASLCPASPSLPFPPRGFLWGGPCRWSSLPLGGRSGSRPGGKEQENQPCRLRCSF